MTKLCKSRLYLSFQICAYLHRNSLKIHLSLTALLLCYHVYNCYVFPCKLLEPCVSNKADSGSKKKIQECKYNGALKINLITICSL